MSRSALLACALVVVGGCSASHSPEDAAAAADASRADAGPGACATDAECLEVLHRASCDHFLAVHRLAPGIAGDYTDLCVTERSPNLRRVRDAVARGDLGIDPAALARCIAGGASVLLEDTYETSADCAAMWIPRAPVGAPCDTSYACMDGFCMRSDYARSRPDYVAGGCGVCAPRGGEGAPCSGHGWVGASLECRPDLACDDATGTCWRHGAIGERCSPSVACVEGGVCVEGTCVAPVAVGAACSLAAPCAPSASCLGSCPDGSVCSGGSSCVDGSACAGATCIANVPLGGACDDGHLCQDAACHLGRCSLGADVGESCAGYFCREDLFCTAASVCEGPVAPGQACEADAHCPAGQGCDGVCRPWIVVGGACGAAVEGRCVPGTACTGGACRILPSLGEACASGCLVGECVAGVCTSASAGSPCDLGDRRCGALVCVTAGNTCELAGATCDGLGACPYEQFCATGGRCTDLCYVGR